MHMKHRVRNEDPALFARQLNNASNYLGRLHTEPLIPIADGVSLTSSESSKYDKYLKQLGEFHTFKAQNLVAELVDDKGSSSSAVMAMKARHKAYDAIRNINSSKLVIPQVSVHESRQEIIDGYQFDPSDPMVEEL